MKKKMLILAALLVLAFIFLQSTVPEQRSDNESIWFNARIMTPLLKRMGYSAVSSKVVRKAAHISEFFVLSLFAAHMEGKNHSQLLYRLHGSVS